MSDRRNLPEELATLGFSLDTTEGVEYIFPPVRQIAAGEFVYGNLPPQDQAVFAEMDDPDWIYLPSYGMAKYPVTVAEYACFVRDGHAPPSDSNVRDLTWKAQ